MTVRPNKRQQISLPDHFVPRFWEEEDGRLGVVREIRTRYEALKADAGADCVQKEMLAQRAVFIAIQLETMEIEAVQGGKLDLGRYAQLVNSLVGLLKALGLERHIRDGVVDLDTYKSRRATA